MNIYFNLFQYNAESTYSTFWDLWNWTPRISIRFEHTLVLMQLSFSSTQNC